MKFCCLFLITINIDKYKIYKYIGFKSIKDQQRRYSYHIFSDSSFLFEQNAGPL